MRNEMFYKWGKLKNFSVQSMLPHERVSVVWHLELDTEDKVSDQNNSAKILFKSNMVLINWQDKIAEKLSSNRLCSFGVTQNNKQYESYKTASSTIDLVLAKNHHYTVIKAY